tara:strand:+ start:620 stop:1264 length:645 start_codon:yes stop_codon:yes gene_type:complete
MEEPSANYSGPKYVKPYEDRLRKAGCTRIEFVEVPIKVPLSVKWIEIAKRASFPFYALVASDDYNHPDRLQKSVEALQQGKAWVDWDRGLFLDVRKHTTGEWRRPSPDRTGLFMSTHTKYVSRLLGPYPDRYVDGWMRDQTPAFLNDSVRHRYEELPMGLDTDGHNQISAQRTTKYSEREYKPPFHEPSSQVKEVLPEEVFDMLVDKFMIPKFL